MLLVDLSAWIGGFGGFGGMIVSGCDLPEFVCSVHVFVISGVAWLMFVVYC